MTVAVARPVRRKRRRPKPLAALLDDVLKLADADLSNEEAVHDLRVACRRLEAGTRVNEGVLSRRQLRDVRDATKLVRRAFDQARDLEVIAAELEGVVGLSDGFRAAVKEAAGEHATGARGRGKVADAIGTIRKARAGLADGATPERAALAATLATHIETFFDELDRVLAVSSDDALHEARISAKKLRYEIEIGAPAFPRLRAQVKRLKRLQDILGRHQDGSVGLLWAEELTVGSLAATAADRIAVMHHYDRLRRTQRSQLRRLLAGWREMEMRGRFLRALGTSAASSPANTTASLPDGRI